MGRVVPLLLLMSCWPVPDTDECLDPELWYAPDGSGDVFWGCASDVPAGWANQPPGDTDTGVEVRTTTGTTDTGPPPVPTAVTGTTGETGGPTSTGMTGDTFFETGDTFLPTGDTFVPTGDTFMPTGETGLFDTADTGVP